MSDLIMGKVMFSSTPMKPDSSQFDLMAPKLPARGTPLWPAPEGKYKRFMPQVLAIAEMSAYLGTHVGALVLGEDCEPLSSGWNGAPRGSSADSDERSVDREERLKWVVHSEANAIANAARSGAKLKGATIIVTHPPCLNCALLIVQSGIKRVMYPKPGGGFAERWGADNQRAKFLFRECGVQYHEIDTTEK